MQRLRLVKRLCVEHLASSPRLRDTAEDELERKQEPEVRAEC